MLEVGKSYTGPEIAKLVFDISPKSFSNRREVYLEKLAEYYEWEYSKRKFTITAIKQTYEGTLGRNSKMEIQQEIRQPVHQVVNQYPLQTYKSIAQIMLQENGPYVRKHPQQESTIAKYVKGVMQTDYAVREWVWSDVNQLPIQPLTSDQKSYLSLLIHKKNGMTNDELHFMVKAMEDAGYIDEEEAKDLLYEAATRDYEEVMYRFQMKYNFRPRLIASWQEGVDFGEPIIPYGRKK